MARPTTRRSPRLENLEARKLLSADVTGEQQMMLELINEALVAPDLAAERVEQGLTKGAINAISRDGSTVEEVISEIASSESRPPVAWDSSLAEAAKRHTEYQINLGAQTHSGPRGLATVTDRVLAAGYDAPAEVAENIIYGVDSPEHAMRAFLADYGTGNASNPHRENILRSESGKKGHAEVGVAIVPVEVPVEFSTPFGSPSNPKTETKLVVTQVFATKNEESPKVLGVVFDDTNNDRFYDVGEGVSNASVTITNSNTGQSKTVKTWSSGGYQAEVTPGHHTIEVRVNDRLIGAREALVGRENAKVDFRVNDMPKAAAQTVVPTGPKTSPRTAPAVRSTPVSTPKVVTVSTPRTSPSVSPPRVVRTPAPTPAPAAPPTVSTPSIDPTPVMMATSQARASRASTPQPSSTPEFRDGTALSLLRTSSLKGTLRSWRLAEGGMDELELSSSSSR